MVLKNIFNATFFNGKFWISNLHVEESFGLYKKLTKS